jgi:hypothetical protein
MGTEPIDIRGNIIASLQTYQGMGFIRMLPVIEEWSAPPIGIGGYGSGS